MEENYELAPYLLTIKEWENWLIRLAVSLPLLMLLAFVLKHTLIEPNSIQMLELNIEFNYEPASKKGDKEI